jgi:hypothetical protein
MQAVWLALLNLNTEYWFQVAKYDAQKINELVCQGSGAVQV